MNSNIVNNKKSICFFTTVKFNSFAFDLARNFNDYNFHYFFNGSNTFYRRFTRNVPNNTKSILNVTAEVNSFRFLTKTWKKDITKVEKIC